MGKLGNNEKYAYAIHQGFNHFSQKPRQKATVGLKRLSET